jgi:hypothetical protein
MRTLGQKPIGALAIVRTGRYKIYLKDTNPPCFLSQMANDWTTTYCTQEEGFSKVLYAATV